MVSRVAHVAMRRPGRSEERELLRRNSAKTRGMMTAVIDSFRGEYKWLSNYEIAPVVIEGITYSSNEHAFQALKANNLRQREWVSEASTCREAKARGQQVLMRWDWEQVKIDVMRRINYDKFTRHPPLTDKLLATDEAHLIEGNTWGDTFWGVCNGVGENHLGRILMERRARLRDHQRVRG